MICKDKWDLETITRIRIVEDWIRDRIVNRGSGSNPDRIILVKAKTPIALVN
jgi:hypothetical protein